MFISIRTAYGLPVIIDDFIKNYTHRYCSLIHMIYLLISKFKTAK